MQHLAMCRPAIVTVSMAILLAIDCVSLRAQPPQSVLSIPAMPNELRASDDRFERLERWILATARHRAGQSDEFSHDIASLGLTDLQGLWIETNALARVMRDRRASAFRLGMADGSSARIVYTRAQLETLQRFACIVGGYLDPSGFAMQSGTIARECVSSVPLNELAPELRDIALRFGTERVRRGDDNLFWRRSALLHSDVAMLEQPQALPLGTSSLPLGPRRMRVELLDGRRRGITLAGIHWSLAETLLGFVKPADAPSPAPGRDAMVRDWYEATTAWMQAHEQRDLEHLQAGLALFNDDPNLLFLSGCEHEAYASPPIQVPLEGTPRTLGPVHSARSELELAESDFRRSLAEDAFFAEALLHLGHVQLLLGKHREAIDALERTSLAMGADELRYLRDMFLGQAYEHSGSLDDARGAYERARSLFPQAQSSLLALSQLERRSDNYAAAQAAVTEAWSIAPDSDDPWWNYSVSHAVRADALVEAVWRSVE